MTDPAVTADAIEQASRRLKTYLTETPVLRSSLLDLRARGQVLLKAECVQQTGSFKIRGALNRILQLSAEEKSRGVVAFSSGNHAQGVALAAKLTGIEAAIVMPEDAPAVKRDRTRRLGAEVVLYDRTSQSREQIAEDLAEERGAVLVPPFDDPRVITGQGTAGWELALQAKALGKEIDQVLICCSGGGLASGIATAVRAHFPKADIVTVEPNGFDDMKRSLTAGQRVSNAPGGKTLCDSLMVPRPGTVTFPILRDLGAWGVSVSDREAIGAIRFAAEELRVVLEPGGAVALAAVLSGKVETKGRTTAVILSGGNVDPAVFDRAMQYAV